MTATQRGGRGSTPKPGVHSSYLKAKKRNISRDDIERCLTYVNGVQVMGWKETVTSATRSYPERPISAHALSLKTLSTFSVSCMTRGSIRDYGHPMTFWTCLKVSHLAPRPHSTASVRLSKFWLTQGKGTRTWFKLRATPEETKARKHL